MLLPKSRLLRVRLAAGLLLSATLLATASEVAGQGPTSTTPGAQFAAQLLAGWIRQSRDQAIESGVETIPHEISAALSGHVPKDVLAKVRWRSGSPDPRSLAAGALNLHPTPAITLDHVIIFRSVDQARSDPSLWAHELKHVMQYQEWGIDAFALKYVLDYEAVEFEASEFRWAWMEKKRLEQQGEKDD